MSDAQLPRDPDREPTPAGEWPECPPEIALGPPVPNPDMSENGVLRVPGGKTEVYEHARVEFGANLFAEEKPLRWLWPERIALGRVTLIAGASNTGKTWLALDMAARVTRGAPFPGRVFGPERAGNVLLVSGDPDGWDETIRPRLELAGADLTRVWWMNDVERYDPLVPSKERSRTHRRYSFPADLPHVEHHLQNVPGTRLVVLDSLATFCANDRAYRETLRLLDEIAARRNVAIVVVARHT